MELKEDCKDLITPVLIMAPDLRSVGEFRFLGELFHRYESIRFNTLLVHFPRVGTAPGGGASSWTEPSLKISHCFTQDRRRRRIKTGEGLLGGVFSAGVSRSFCW